MLNELFKKDLGMTALDIAMAYQGQCAKELPRSAFCLRMPKRKSRVMGGVKAAKRRYGLVEMK